jgi:tellurite methyltransferase
MPRNWDEFYAVEANRNFTPSSLLVEVAARLPAGRALDLASGSGRNSLYLASLGWRVTAVDSSATAIRLLRERVCGLDIDARRADLEAGQFAIEPGAYDLICDFFYLQRDLFGQIREGVRPGGTFVGAIHLIDDRPDAPPHNPAFLLRPEELRNEFAGWKILYYSEGCEPGRARPAARIVARRA